MNICIFGNQDNSGYRFAKWLREDGHNVELYMMRYWESPRSLPETIDRQLEKEGYPAWIRRYDNTIVHAAFVASSEIARIEANFDIVVVIGTMGMMHAHHFKNIPIVSISTGPANQGVIKMWDHISLKHRLFWTTVRFFVRKSVRQCQKIFVHYDPEIYSLAKLRQQGKILLYGMPEDLDGNVERVDQALLAEMNRNYAHFDKVFLWLGRIAFSDKINPMYKGTDKFIEAAHEVVQGGANIRLVIGRHGEDYEKLREMIEDRRLAPHVEWVDHMPYWKLLTYLSLANSAVVDELTELHCVSSGMFRETLSVGGVLIRSFSPVLTRAGHGSDDCPVLHAETASEVCARMKEVLAWSANEDTAWRSRVRDWSARFLSRRNQIGRLVNHLEEIVYVHRTSQKLKAWYEN